MCKLTTLVKPFERCHQKRLVRKGRMSSAVKQRKWLNQVKQVKYVILHSIRAGVTGTSETQYQTTFSSQ